MSTPLPSEKKPRPPLTYLVPVMLSQQKPARIGTTSPAIHSTPADHAHRGNGALKSMRHSNDGVNSPNDAEVAKVKYGFTSGLETGMRLLPEKPMIHTSNSRTATPAPMVMEFVL